MRVLVTAGSTEVDIDLVRQLRTIDPDYDLTIGNGFKGATGEAIARHLRGLGHKVTILTSDRDFFLHDDQLKYHENLLPTSVKFFRTFNELLVLMEKEIRFGGYDVVIHSAAVSDFEPGRVISYVSNPAHFAIIDKTSKISSSYEQLFLELVPTVKLIDKIRSEWGFMGKLVKFKLQVGKSDEELLEIARSSREVSKANFVVANCREWYKERAYILGEDGTCDNVSRNKLAEKLCRRLGL